MAGDFRLPLAEWTLDDLRQRRTALAGIADRRYHAINRAQREKWDAENEHRRISEEIERRMDAKKGNRP